MRHDTQSLFGMPQLVTSQGTDAQIHSKVLLFLCLSRQPKDITLQMTNARKTEEAES
jgi:hypothetical protein